MSAQPPPGYVRWQGRLAELSLPQWRLWVALVDSETPREPVPLWDVARAVYGRGMRRGPVRAVKEMIRRMLKRLRRQGIYLHAQCHAGCVRLAPRSPGENRRARG